MTGDVSFTIKCKMKARWIPHFITMLKYMQSYGSMGCSREVGIYADGDGDFHPKFEFKDYVVPEESLEKFRQVMAEDVKPVRDKNGDVLFDAG